jgi:excinuclease ABC subunit C
MMREVLTRRFARTDQGRRRKRGAADMGGGRVSLQTRSRHHRRRARPVRRGAGGHGRPRPRAAWRWPPSPRASTATPGARHSSSPGKRAVPAAAARSGAVFRAKRLRDEAHRFAIGTHRARRKKDFVKSPLDEIAGDRPGAQASTAARLRHSQGDFARAALSDLEATPGVNKATAKLVYDFFNEGRG